MSMTRKKANILYSGIMSLYFVLSALGFSFASAYLDNQGFNNTKIGFIITIANVLIIVVLQVVAFVEKKLKLSICHVCAYLVCAIAVFSSFMILGNFSPTVNAILLTCNLVTIGLVGCFINTVYRGYRDLGIKVEFAWARGCGSLSSALSSLFAGFLFAVVSIAKLPMFYLFTAIPLVFLFFIFNSPNLNVDKTSDGQLVGDQKVSLLKEYPDFILFLVGTFLLRVPKALVSSFLYQIMTNIGGDIENVGTALFIAGLVEMPAMLLYNKTRRKIGNRRLLGISCWAQFIKFTLIVFAKTPIFIYMALVFEFFGHAMFVPSSEKHIAHTLPKSQFVRGTSLQSAMTTASYVVASFVSGLLLDRVGVSNTLFIIEILAALGLILMQISIRWSYKRIKASV